MDRTIRLLASVIGRPAPSMAQAILLVEYHIRRNRVARASHEKTWRLKHPDMTFVLL